MVKAWISRGRVPWQNSRPLAAHLGDLASLALGSLLGSKVLIHAAGQHVSEEESDDDRSVKVKFGGDVLAQDSVQAVI